MPNTSIKKFLEHESHLLGNLLTKVKKLQEWNLWLVDCLGEDAHLAKHCHIVELKKKALIVIADNASWVTRFRFQIVKLIPLLQKHHDLSAIDSICCKVRPARYEKKSPSRKKEFEGSAQAVRHIKEVAEKTKDKKLQEAIYRLANRLQKI